MKTPTTRKIGPFVIERRLGVGGMAEVFLARKPLGTAFKHVVVKRMLGDLVEDQRFVEMFLREAGILAQLNHANVVQIFDLGTTDDGYPYFAMEYLEGISVHDLAVRSWKSRRPLPVELVLRVMAEAARGLDYVHKKRGSAGEPLGLVHRDIAPDNMFFVKDGTVKLLDFGVARGATMKVLTARGEVKGKIPFMAPEQLEGHTPDGRADLFSLGVTGFWLLTGRRPFAGNNDLGMIRAILRTDPPPASSLNRELPEWIDALLDKMLAKNPAERTQSGASVESTIIKNAGSQLDRARDVAFVEEMLEVRQDQLDDVTNAIPAVRRAPSGVFNRVNALMAKPQPVSFVDGEPVSVADADVEEFDVPRTTPDITAADSASRSFSETTERDRPKPRSHARGPARTPAMSPMPRAVHVEMPDDVDDPSGDTVRLTESQLGIRRERK